MADARPARLGRYELIAPLGKGGMAEVYAARLDGASGFTKRLAVKRILPHLATDPAFVAMFLAEAKLAAQLAHPKICQVFELVQDGTELFMVLELLDGVAWDRVVARGPVELRLATGVIVQAAEGLQYAHDHGVIHRDVSPHNLFVTVDGTCKVVDFGVAKALGGGGAQTRAGVVKGKLAYMAPEQIRGEPVDARADVFALGVVAWESLVGARLFDRDGDYQTWKAVEAEPIPLARSLRPELPAAIDDVLGGALDRDRTRRFASVRAFANALVQVGGLMLPQEIASALAAVIHEHRARVDAARPVASMPAPTEVSTADRSAASTVDDKGHIGLRAEPRLVRRRSSRGRVVAAMVAVVAIAGVAIAVVSSRGSDRGSDRVDVVAPDAKPSTPARSPTAATQFDVAERRLRDLAAIGGDKGSDLHAAFETLRQLPATLGVAAGGTLSVDSTVPATIYVDDVAVGTTPLERAAIGEGAHRVRAVLGDGRSHDVAVTVEVGRDVVIPKLDW